MDNTDKTMDKLNTTVEKLDETLNKLSLRAAETTGSDRAKLAFMAGGAALIGSSHDVLEAMIKALFH
jgi:hypothetical protein